MERMYYIITISKREDINEFTAFFNKHEISVIYSTPCEGTAREKTLALFGIEETHKTIHYCLVTETKKDELLKGMTNELTIDLPDKGIAIAIPLSSFGGKRTMEMFSNGKEETENKEQSVMKDINKELIVAICEKGHTDDVMDAAREAGAGGGTVIHAKGTGSEYTAKFFGISIADEKEMIYIVATKEKKNDIMKAIMEKSGITSKSHTIVFSLPVSDTAGLRLFDET